MRRNGHLIASDIQGHIEQIRTVAQQEGLSQSCLERIEKAERVVPKMQATIEFVSRYVRQQVDQLDLAQPASFAMHAKLIPSFYLDRVAQTRTVRAGEPLRELAEQLRAPLFEPGGALSELSPEAQDQLHDEAKRLAAVFQRSSSNVEGRNGYLSLRNHQLRGLDLPRKLRAGGPRPAAPARPAAVLFDRDGTLIADVPYNGDPARVFPLSLASNRAVESPP